MPQLQTLTVDPITKQKTLTTGQDAVAAMQKAGGSQQQLNQIQGQLNQQTGQNTKPPVASQPAPIAKPAPSIAPVAQPLVANPMNSSIPMNQPVNQTTNQVNQPINTPINQPRVSPQQVNPPAPTIPKAVLPNQPLSQTPNQPVPSTMPASTQQPNAVAPSGTPPLNQPSSLPPNSPHQTTTVSNQVPVSTGNQTMIQHTDSTGKTSMMSPEEAHQNDINTSLSNVGNQSMSDGLQGILSAPPGTSAAEILKQNLISELGMINDPTTNKILDNSAQRAKSSYDAGLAMTQTSLDEINKAIDGTLEAPSTAAGIQAKIYKQSETQQQAALANEENYQQQSHENQMSQLRDNRSRLEGYSKAKLEAMGQGDSSAGITLLSKINQSADLQIEQANLDYGHAHQQLVLQGNQIMNDYTNQVSSLTQQTNAQKATYLKDFNDTISGIQDKQLASEQEKNKLRITAFSNYNDKTATLAATQKQQQLDYLKFAYDQHKDLIDQSYKLSGMMGTVYVPGANGQLQDTGIATLDSKKNQMDFAYKTSTLALDQQKFGLSQDQFGFDQYKFGQTQGLEEQKFGLLQSEANVKKVTAQFDFFQKSGWNKDVANSFDQMTGSPQGTYSQFSNASDAKTYFNNTQQANQSQLDQLNKISPQIIASPACKQVFNVGGLGGQCGTWASTISTAPKVGNTWNEKISKVDKQDNPMPGDKILVPLAGASTDGNRPGHVAVVLGGNVPIVNVVQANMDGKGTISMGSYNMDTLNSKYGKNWGFVSGQFQPNIATKLSQLQPQDTQVQTYHPPAPASLMNPGGGMDWGKLSQSINNNFMANGNQATKEAFLKNWQDPTSPNSAANQKNSINNALQHLGEAYKAYSLMNNLNIKDENGIRDYMATHGENAELAGYMSIKGDAAAEVAKAILGGTPGKEEMDAEVKTLSQDLSPKEMMATIQAKVRLIGGRSQTLAQDWKEAMGSISPNPILNSKSQEAVKSLNMDPAELDPVLEFQQQNPDYKSQIASAQGAGYNNGQIFSHLLANPHTSSQAAHLASLGYSPDTIIQALQNS